MSADYIQQTYPQLIHGTLLVVLEAVHHHSYSAVCLYSTGSKKKPSKE